MSQCSGWFSVTERSVKVVVTRVCLGLESVLRLGQRPVWGRFMLTVSVWGWFYGQNKSKWVKVSVGWFVTRVKLGSMWNNYARVLNAWPWLFRSRYRIKKRVLQAAMLWFGNVSVSATPLAILPRNTIQAFFKQRMPVILHAMPILTASGVVWSLPFPSGDVINAQPVYFVYAFSPELANCQIVNLVDK